MISLQYKTKGNSSPNKKPRVYFTCHPEDFDKSFDKICDDIFNTHNCAIYYTEDLTAAFDEQNLDTDLGNMNLFVIPVTLKLLTKPNRAMDFDFAYAKQKHIPVLPIMLEPGIDDFYSRPDKFGELQYLNPYSTDLTEISYEEKLKKYLESVLISDEMAKRVRAAFDAYIFLSYRKKDRRYANELMRLIHAKPEFRDIAIWYDEFLTPGENFNENIGKMLNDSKLFALLVTPNLLEEPDGKPNFVMGEEYPMAKRKGMDILPAEMEDTDKDELNSKFKGLPECVNPHEDELFKARLLQSITKIAKSENDDNPEHNFLIGLAYLDGIDVETDRERGIELLIKAAESNLPEAVKKLYELQYSAYESSDFSLYDKISSVTPKLAQIDADYYVRSEILRAEQLLSVYKKYDEAIEIFNSIHAEFKNVLNKNIEAYISFEINQIYILNEHYKKREEALVRINALLKKISLCEIESKEKAFYKRFAKLYYHKGLIEYGLGSYNECIVSCQKAFDMSELGYDEPNRLKSLILIVTGSYHLKMKDYEKAITDFNESLKMRLRLYGENNLYVANSYKNLIKAYYRKAIYFKCHIDSIADELLKKWKSMVEAVVGKESLNMAYCYYWEAKLREYQNKIHIASECANKALEINTRFNDFGSEELAEMENIANLKN